MAKKTAKKSRAKPASKRRSQQSPRGNSAPGQENQHEYALRVRMYRQGLGDCFLLSFPKPEKGYFHLLIDCGVIQGTPDGASLMRAVAADIAQTTAGKIDVLVATHEHWDHLSGFIQAKETFENVEVGQVWLAWTEDPRNDSACRLRTERAHRLAALWIGLSQMHQRLDVDGQARSTLERASQILSFFGIDPAVDKPPPAGLGVAAAAALKTTGDAMDWLRAKSPAPRFFEPGEQIELEGTGGVQVYVLGPPTDTAKLFKDLPTSSGRETYGARLAAAEREFFTNALFGDGMEADGLQFYQALRFESKYRIDEVGAQEMPFFRDHYFRPSDGDDEAWRRIDANWTNGAAELALKLDNDTNNTSLALAFELPDGRVLLFPGDAQVGNWESWHVDDNGQPRVWQVGTRNVTTKSLLNRTVLYKVGHHGSHNATLRAQGLEMMIDSQLAAMLPVDVYIAHEKKGWKEMPFEPLLDRLNELAQGRILQADQDKQALPGESADRQSSRLEAIERFLARVTEANQPIGVATPGKKNVQRPLYFDYLL